MNGVIGFGEVLAARRTLRTRLPEPGARALGWRRARLRSVFAIRALKRILHSPGAEAKLAEKKWGGEDWQGRSAAPRPPSREGKKAITAWYDPGVLKQLKQIAIDEDTNLPGAALKRPFSEVPETQDPPDFAVAAGKGAC